MLLFVTNITCLPATSVNLLPCVARQSTHHSFVVIRGSQLFQGSSGRRTRVHLNCHMCLSHCCDNLPRGMRAGNQGRGEGQVRRAGTYHRSRRGKPEIILCQSIESDTIPPHRIRMGYPRRTCRGTRGDRPCLRSNSGVR